MLAFETARYLIKKGINVPGVVCIDSPAPRSQSWLSDMLIDSVFTAASAGDMKQRRLLDSVRTNMKHSTRALADYDPSTSPAAGIATPKVALLRSEQDISFEGLSREHFLVNRKVTRHVVDDWESFIGGAVSVIDIPGNHFEVFEPQNVCHPSIGRTCSNVIDRYKVYLVH